MALLARLFRCFKHPPQICPYTPSFDELYPQGFPKARLVRQGVRPQADSSDGGPLLDLKGLSAMSFFIDPATLPFSQPVVLSS